MKAFALVLSLVLATAALAQQRNILLVIADDYGVDSNSLYNSSGGAALPPTPNINALKTTGVLFRNAYSHPTCSPSRATLFTGRHPFRHGVTTAVTANDGQLSAGEFTLPRAFAANSGLGYSTALLGKWHLTIGPNIANDPTNIGGWPYYAGCLQGGLNSYTAWTKTINGTTGATNGTTTYATTDVTNDAIAWINARGTSPWFACVAYNAPHTPFHKPPNNLHTYDTTVAGWGALAIPGNQRTHYNAAAEAMDTEFGRLLASLTTTVRNNTIIIFVGDNGSPAQVVQTPYSSTHGKDTLYDGGVHVPLLISSPDIVSPNRDVTEPVHVADLYPTILDLAGINVAATQPSVKPLDGRSLKPALLNQSLGTTYGYAEQSGSTLTTAESGRAVRNASYRFMRFNDGTERLHYLPGDPDEQSNLVGTALTAPQQAAYTELSTQLGTYTAPSNPTYLPLETQWQKFNGAEYARIYKTQARALAGLSDTTWLPAGQVTGGGQATPSYAGIESIRVSQNWVYVKGSGLPHYTMGPWYFDAGKTQPFVAYPSQWEMLTRLPRLPVPATTRSNTNFGPIAIWVNSAIIHNQLDAFYWNGTADSDTGATGTEYWTRNARFAEGLTFDPAGAHQPSTGESHHHINPYALRFEMGDHMNYNPATHTYAEATTPPNHSPILGWSFDGYPIYGPYGYSSAMNAGSGVRRMVSGYVPRDGSFGTTNLNTAGRATLPAWAVRAGHGNSTAADASTAPAVSTSFPIGWYLQDYDYLGDLGYTQGTSFDLDDSNGRWCVTPEFPSGTYAYFVTLDASSQPAYPYIIGRQYYGVKQGGNYGGTSTVGFSAVESPATTVYQGGAAAALSTPASTLSGNQITLQWTSVEGGRYSIESSTDLSSWGTPQTNLAGAASQTQTTLNTTGFPKAFFRVRRDSVDSYDVNTLP